MKVAATLTNTTTEATALPSLLSLGAELPLRSDERPAEASPETSATELPASFDAMLAMIQLAQNLPLPLPEPADAAATNFVSTAMPAAMPVVEPTALATIPLRRVELITQPAQRLIPSPSETSRELSGQTETMRQSSERGVFSNVTPVAEPIVAAKRAPFDGSEQANTVDLFDRSPIERTSDTVDPQASSVESPETKASSLDVGFEKSAESSPVDSSLLAAKPIATGDGPIKVTAGIVATGVHDPRLQRPLDLVREIHPLKTDRHRRSASEEPVPVAMIGLTSHAGDAADHVTRLNSTALTESVAAAVQSHANDLAANRPVEVQLRLDPPELGTVRVHLRVTDESVSIRFIAGDEAVTRLLETQLPDLRQSLAERGLSFAQCDVSCDSRQQSSAGFGFGQDQEPFASASSTRSAPACLGRPSPASVAHQSRVDLFA